MKMVIGLLILGLLSLIYSMSPEFNGDHVVSYIYMAGCAYIIGQWVSHPMNWSEFGALDDKDEEKEKNNGREREDCRI